MNHMTSLPSVIFLLMIYSICEQLSNCNIDKKKGKNSSFFCNVSLFSLSVQMYKLHQNEQAKTDKTYTHRSHMSDKHIKQCIPYTQSSSSSSSNQNRSNEKKRKKDIEDA